MNRRPLALKLRHRTESGHVILVNPKLIAQDKVINWKIVFGHEGCRILEPGGFGYRGEVKNMSLRARGSVGAGGVIQRAPAAEDHVAVRIAQQGGEVLIAMSPG